MPNGTETLRERNGKKNKGHFYKMPEIQKSREVFITIKTPACISQNETEPKINCII
jgi:hypothetical protein